MLKKRKLAVTGLAVLLIGGAAGCKKKAAVATPPAPAVQPAVAPKPEPPQIVEFVTEPNSIQKGEYALLRWLVTNATEVTIEPNLGSVAAKARQRISPGESTKYVLVAKGPGGEATASTGITVTAPPVPPPRPATTATLGERIAAEVHDAYFDFDRSDLRPDAIAALTHNASALKRILDDFPRASFIVQGHCDERGSAQYNIGLGDRRAQAAKTFLASIGVPAQRLLVISYGKEHPQCVESNEECWQRNRRVHFVSGEDVTNLTAQASTEADR